MLYAFHSYNRVNRFAQSRQYILYERGLTWLCCLTTIYFSWWGGVKRLFWLACDRLLMLKCLLTWRNFEVICSYPSVLIYVLGAQKNRLIETVLLSTRNICFG